MKFTAKIENIEIRGYEIKESATTGNSYMLLRVEDETGQLLEFADRNYADREQYYKKGTTGDLVIRIEEGYSAKTQRRWTNFTVTNFFTK